MDHELEVVEGMQLDRGRPIHSAELRKRLAFFYLFGRHRPPPPPFPQPPQKRANNKNGEKLRPKRAPSQRVHPNGVSSP